MPFVRKWPTLVEIPAFYPATGSYDAGTDTGNTGWYCASATGTGTGLYWYSSTNGKLWLHNPSSPSEFAPTTSSTSDAGTFSTAVTAVTAAELVPLALVLKLVLVREWQALVGTCRPLLLC